MEKYLREYGLNRVLVEIIAYVNNINKNETDKNNKDFYKKVENILEELLSDKKIEKPKTKKVKNDK